MGVCASRSTAPGERGFALIGTLLLLLIVSSATTALWISGQTEAAMAINHETSAQAKAAAEAGANHAVDLTLTFVRRWRANGFATPAAAITSLLLGPDTQSGTVATDADNGSLENWGIPRPPARLALPGAAGATYEARLFDEDDPLRGLTLGAVDRLRIAENGQPAVDANNRVLIQAIGHTADGTHTSVEVMLVPAPAPAVVSNGDLTVEGNAGVLGTNGHVHSNAALEVGGNADIDGNATASGGYTENGSPDIGGSTSGSAMSLYVIDIYAADYRYLADLVLTIGGVITDLIGGVICDASADAGACETAGYTWRYDGAAGWSANSLGANADNRTFYAETDLTITGNIGTVANPWNLTLIAEGNIDISGNGTIEADSPGLLFVTDQDLHFIGGKDQVGAEAQILIREQVFLGGNVSLRGELVIEDAAQISSLVTSSRIGGNVTVTNNGTLIGTSFRVGSWREI